MTDFTKLIDKNLVKALKISDSLLVDAIFNKKGNQSYNFNTAAKVETDDGSVPRRILVIETKTRKDVVTKKILFDRIEGLDAYDKVIVGNKTWIILDTILDNAFTQILEIQNG